MFKKSQRLNRTDFNEYFKIGRRIHSANFTLIYSPAPVFLISVVAGKKVFKEAVDRNRLRRRVYAIARVYFVHLEISQGVFLIIAKPTAKKLERKAIKIEMETLLALASKAR